MANENSNSTVDSQLRHTKHQSDQSVQPESATRDLEDQQILQPSEEGNRTIEQNMSNSVGPATENL